jgi:hypothetical protein
VRCSESGAFQEGSEPWITAGASVRMMMFYGLGFRRVSLQLFPPSSLSFLFPFFVWPSLLLRVRSIDGHSDMLLTAGNPSLQFQPWMNTPDTWIIRNN